MNAEQLALLEQAREKAQRLVDSLQSRQAQVEANPPADVPPARLEMGRQAMQKAIDAARRSLAALNDARQLARRQIDQPGTETDSSSDQT